MPLIKHHTVLVDDGLQVSARSIISGKWSSMVLPITGRRFAEWRDGGVLIQDAFPDLTVEQREFLLTGMSLEEQEEFFDE